MPLALNTLTGLVDYQPDHIVEHPILGRYLLEVPEGTKPLLPGMFKPGTKDEFEEYHQEEEAPAPVAPVAKPEEGDNK